ncbi:hypothetical protein [Mycetocola saprophilus]|uniref:hypothetical protein n=1 Tax=Mycetocola saprophilus TaxID=76636 RepID=UPI003BF4361D
MSGWIPRELDGIAAARILGQVAPVTPGTCLNAVWRAFGSPRSDGGHDGYPWATDALASARDYGAIRGTRLEDAPDGAVLYWTNVVGTWNRGDQRVRGDAGHVAIKHPGGLIAGIDNPVHARTGTTPVGKFYKPGWAHLRFAGWADGPGAFLGHTVISARPESRPKPNTPNAITPAPEVRPILGVEDMPKIIRATSPVPGTIALITETSARVYTSVSGSQAFSIGANSKVFGEVSGLTEDEVTTLVNEARARGAEQARAVAAELAKAGS